MVYSLMFSLPGTPVLFYGEEIGMGENLSIGTRQSVRTPMQWTAGKNGGFSNARKSKLVSPVTEGGFAPEHVNASDQRQEPESMLRFMQRLIQRYRASAELGWGELQLFDTDSPAVLAHAVEGAEGRMVAVHNLSGEPATVSFVVDRVNDTDTLVDLLFDGLVVTPSEKGEVSVSLDGYGFRWLRVLGAEDKRLC
jgi:glycosidase